LAVVVTGTLLLLLAACSQQPQDVDSIAPGQSVSFTEVPVAATDGSAITSPYAGQETRKIKSLSTEDIIELETTVDDALAKRISPPICCRKTF
jgi:hypothetical protein